MIDRTLLLDVVDQDSLVNLLKTREDRGGLGWQVDADDTFDMEPDIAAGVKGDGSVKISRLVRSSNEQERLILLAEFERPYVRRDLRELLSSVRREIREKGRFADHAGLGDILFIVVSPGYEDLRFVLFEERERRLPRIRSFGWRKELVGRTVLTHNLNRLVWSDQPGWEKAWDVEGLTDEFYTEFVKVFDAVKLATVHPGGEEKKHAYVQQLLNRLLFIAFIERMGWLKTPEGDSDYLHAQWVRFQDRESYAQIEDKSLIPATFNGLLGWLFFRGLDDPKGVNPGDQLFPILGEVPYLNGGLFSEEADLDVSGVTVFDEVFERILGEKRPGFDGGLFRRFNFTVTESTPLDQEVAVDPEMLGTIFERLVTGRHETGAYYTPRGVVEFMVKQALRSYLESSGLPAEKAEPLVENYDVRTLSHPESKLALDALKAVRAVDPACGSGAYLMGMHQAIFDMIDALVLPFEGRKIDVLYHRKLRLLQDTIYGVDIDQTAVRIARLRLWLSLVVENHGVRPEPLPHLDFKIEHGDSLTFPVQQSEGQSTSTGKLLEDFTQAKLDSDDPDYDGRRGSQEERRSLALALREDLRSFYPSHGVHAFNWKAEFFEVLGKGRHGFDIVLANPPYVRADAQFKYLLPDNKAQQDAIHEWKAYRESLKASKTYETLHDKWDIYIPFIERAHQLLCSGGQMVLIIPDTYNFGKYAFSSRKFFIEKATVKRIDFCSDINLFSAEIKNTIIHISKISDGHDHEPERYYRSGKEKNDFDIQLRQLRSGTQAALEHQVFNPKWDGSISNDSFPTLGDICYLSVGMVIHADEKTSHGMFTTQELISPTEDSIHSKPFVQGREINKWNIRSWQYLEWGTARAPGQFRRQTFPELYSVQEKIITLNIGASDIRVAYDDCRLIHNHSASSVVPWRLLKGIRNRSIALSACYIDESKVRKGVPTDRLEREELSEDFQVKYLLAVMNSRYVIEDMSRRRRSGLNIYAEDWRTLRIPPAVLIEQDKLIEFVDCILKLRKENPGCDVSDLEAEIDKRVEFLYFHADEAPTYDEWMAKKEAERGTAVEAIRKLISEGESGSAEFKQSLEYVDSGRYENVPEAQRSQRTAEARKNVVHSAPQVDLRFSELARRNSAFGGA